MEVRKNGFRLVLCACGLMTYLILTQFVPDVPNARNAATTANSTPALSAVAPSSPLPLPAGKANALNSTEPNALNFKPVLQGIGAKP